MYNKKGIIELENDKTWCSTRDEPGLWLVLNNIKDLLT